MFDDIFLGSRDAYITGQRIDNISTTSEPTVDTEGSVHPSSCVGGGGACTGANESLSLQSNFSDVDWDREFGLNHVTAAVTNYTLPEMFILGILAGTTSFVTISGNLVVILSFIIERSIRQPSNYFIASLAVSDLLIGSISMPFYTVYLLSGKYWPLGAMLCDLWLSLDYTVCLSSIYTVFCITIDRFCSVKIPAKYRNWRTERKVLTIICVTWVIPVLVFFTSIIGWQYFVGKRRVDVGMCYVQYMEDAIFNLLLQFGYFWITLTVMCSLYAGIYRVALRLQRQSEAKQQRRTALLVSVAGGAMSKIGIEMSQQQQQGAPSAAPLDQNTTNGQQNSSNIAGGNGVRNVEPSTKANVTPSPALIVASKSTKKGKRSKKGQQYVDEDYIDDHQSSSFACTSDSEQDDVQHMGKSLQSKRASVAKTSAQGQKTSDKTSKSKRTKRRPATRHTSPVVAVERAVQFVAKQQGITDDVQRPEMEIPASLHCSADCSAGQARVASEDYAHRSFDALSGGCSFAVEPPTSNCSGRDHQCVFEAWRRPMPKLSPVWVRRQVGGQNRSRGDCDNTRVVGSTDEVHIVVDVDDNDGRATCGCHFPTSLTGTMSCLSRFSLPAGRASPTTELSCATSVTTKTTTAIAQRKGGGDQHRRSSVARHSATNQKRKPFVIVAALRRLPRSRRWRRARDAAGSSATATARTASKNENRARKSLRTITIILGAFVLCWTPWHVLSMIMGFCPPCVEPVIYDISYWLCYLNSPINPLCYAFANQQFKKTFLRIFRFDWHRT